MASRVVIRRRGEAKRDTAAEFPFQEKDVRELSRRAGEPAWMLDYRLRAFEVYRGLPMPSLTDEAWRRTDLRAIPSDQVQLRAAENTPIDPEFLRPLVGERHAALLTLRPGHAAERQIDPALAEQGVIFTDWASAVSQPPEGFAAALDRVLRPEEGKFAALAAAMAADGVVLWVPPRTEVTAPLHSILWAPGAGTAFFSRVFVAVGEGSRVTFVHEAASPTEPSGHAIHAGLVSLDIGAGSQVTFVELQSWGEHVWNFTHERARVERDGHLDWIFGAVGSHLTKNFTELDLAGAGSSGRMSGFYFTDGVQHLDHDTQQNHLAPNTTSDLLFKGALVDRSRSVWQGMIYVAPAAQKSDGYQANRNLILSPKARADSIPGLEILADDVRCTHGATVGQLDPEPIFYLMSRGLPRREAERVVVNGFFDPILQRIPFEGVRERFQRMMNEKLS